jgi:hypothetical protein
MVVCRKSLLDGDPDVLRFEFCFVSLDFLVLREVLRVFGVVVGFVRLGFRSGVEFLCAMGKVISSSVIAGMRLMYLHDARRIL